MFQKESAFRTSHPFRQAVIVMVTVGITGTILGLFSHADTPLAVFEAENGTLSGHTGVVADSDASGGQAVQFGTVSTTNCVVDQYLVNSCRPWLGEATNSYPGTTTILSRFQNAEQRLGRQLDVVHLYDTPGDTLSGDALTLATRANTFLMLNWKPALVWSDAGGANATVNAQIDAMASSIKAIAPKKLFLTVFHEPENDVSSGSAGCGAGFAYKGTAGTPSDYVAMWHNVRSRFDALGVNNVVWAMTSMSDPTYNCMEKDLWPGNSYVDWITYDDYVRNTGANSTFNGAIGAYYNFLTANSDAAHDFLSKTWGVNEWGTSQRTQAAVYQTYADAKAAIDNNTYPKIKLWSLFDENDTTSGLDYRTQYDSNSVLDQTEQNDYNAFANDPNISGDFTGP